MKHVLMFECLFSDTDTESEGEVEETSIEVEKITRLEAAQKKARIDLAVKGIKQKSRPKPSGRVSPKKMPSMRIPKRKAGDSLYSSSEKSSDEDDEGLEETRKEGANKTLSPPAKKLPKKSGTAGPKISDMFPDPASWPYNLTKEAVDKMSMKEFLKTKELALREKQLKATEKDIPGNIMETTVLTLPPLEAVGGHHDYLKILCPASLLHMPLGDPADWWPLLPVEWPLVTGKN